MNLTEKAKSKKVKRSKETIITNEQIDLAKAWSKDEISHSQVMFALKRTSSMYGYVKLAFFMREAVRKGNLVWKK